ncbi:MAG: hypothetical protein M1820_005189 [Bogoriella megaspora]|nr:MAG: hypothetical protein M1820_005189 [Bogoriella megaspora]
MLPLGLLTAAQGQPMLVELKSGDSVQGHLLSCDTFMNVMLKEAIQTSADGQKFVGLRECYIRGSNSSKESRNNSKVSSQLVEDVVVKQVNVVDQAEGEIGVGEQVAVEEEEDEAAAREQVLEISLKFYMG